MSCKHIHFQARNIQTLRQEDLHTITRVYAHFSADRTEKSGTPLQLFTVTHPHPGCKGKDRQKVEILTCLQVQKPWQRSLLLANTDLLKNTSINTPKLSWFQERNKVAFPPNPWEGLSQLNPPHLDRQHTVSAARICLKHRLFWRLATSRVHDDSSLPSLSGLVKRNQLHKRWDFVSLRSILLTPPFPVTSNALLIDLFFLRVQNTKGKWETTHIDSYNVLTFHFWH